jgi:excisionase family DNA binding protein
MLTVADKADHTETKYVSVAEEARRLSVTPEFLHKLGREGRLKVFRLGRKALLRKGALDEMLEASVAG